MVSDGRRIRGKGEARRLLAAAILYAAGAGCVHPDASGHAEQGAPARFATQPIPTVPDRCPYNHSASIVQTASGDLLTAWGAGSRELGPDTVILLSRKTAGQDEWSPPIIVADKPDDADANPVLFVDDLGGLWLFHVEMFGGEFCLGRVVVQRSENDGLTWTKPEVALDAICTMVRNKPIILGDGQWLLPAYQQAIFQSQFWLSGDRGRSWRPTPPLYTAADNNLQPAVVELSDGSLLAMMRSGGNARQTWEGRSTDAGLTWKLRQRPDLPNPNSGLDMIRLATGELLLVYNPSRADRTPLAVSYSTDDGRTWSSPITIANGKPQLSYPCVIQDRAGIVHVVFSHRLTHIEHVTFDRAWLVTPRRPP